MDKRYVFGVIKGVLLCLVIISLTGTVLASGNITTTSGDLFLSPASNNVLPSANNSFNLGDTDHRWSSVYTTNIRNVRSIYMDTSSVEFRISTGNAGPSFVLDGTEGTGGIPMGFYLLSPWNQPAELRWRPGNNASREVSLAMNPINDLWGRRGLVLYATVGSTDNQFIPGEDGSYKFGTASNRWGSINTVNITISSLTGSGNAYVCVDSTGRLYRSASACA